MDLQGVLTRPIDVRIDNDSVPIDSTVFTLLLGGSMVRHRADYVKALKASSIKYATLVRLARTADIPYTLFFAPETTVRRLLSLKSAKLLAGVSKNSFSINTRNRIELHDVELIVKDLLRKQEELKRLDASLSQNKLVGSLRRVPNSMPQAADELRELIGFTVPELRKSGTKEAAFALLVKKLESKQVLISQSQSTVMPQLIPRGVKLSGICVKDRKVPYIFLSSSDAEENWEPAGRRIFTLTLLAVLIARNRFSAVTYESNVSEPIQNLEYELTEEILLPVEDFRSRPVDSLTSIQAGADSCHVTPSAFVMRARRLGMLTKSEASGYLEDLREEFAIRPRSPMNRPLKVTALRKYNGAEFTRRMFSQLDRGRISPGEFRRIVCLNHIGFEGLGALRRTL